MRKARERKGLTQKDLSQLCNFSINQISRYENGAIDPTSENLKILAQHVSVSSDYLLGLSDEPLGIATPSDIATDERHVLDVYRRDGWPGLLSLVADHMGKK